MHMSRSVAMAAVVLAFFALRAAASGLDGKTFHGEIVDDKGVVRSKDVVTFKDGNFHSVTCARFGFAEAPYWTRVEGDAVHFLAESTHPDNGTMQYKGTVRGDEAEWSAVWTKKRWYWSIRREIAFRGTEQK
jgi:hypothetical protein